MRILVTALLIGLALGYTKAQADDSKTREQIWEGVLKVRPGVELCLIVRLKDQLGGKFAAVMDSPDEGFKELELTSVTLDKTQFPFELKVSQAKYEEES